MRKERDFLLLSWHLRPQKAYGLLGTAEEWDRECRELRPTSVFTQLQLARGQGSDRKQVKARLFPVLTAEYRSKYLLFR